MFPFEVAVLLRGLAWTIVGSRLGYIDGGESVTIPPDGTECSGRERRQALSRPPARPR
jgi:hypothetical protein